MKLELKHLAPYLPYGLKININGYSRLLTGIKQDKEGNLNINYGFVMWESMTENKKPILRPLSDLDQDGEINTPEYLKGCCYSYIQNLISQHYDVFGLIEKGLAIDINTMLVVK